MTDYVAGFALGDDGSVAMVRKLRPEWQRGRLNAIGGKVEPGETVYQAMRREYLEEAGVDVPDWVRFAAVSGPWGRVDFFRTRFRPAVDLARTVEDEEIVVVEDGVAIAEGLPNISWLLPLARYSHDRYRVVEAVEL